MNTDETLETLRGIRPMLMQLQPEVKTTQGRSLLARILASVDAVEAGVNENTPKASSKKKAGKNVN